MLPPPPPHPTFLVWEKEKGKLREKRTIFKAETIERLSPRSKCYYFSHCRVSRIQKFFLSANHGTDNTFQCSMPLYYEIHFAGPGIRFILIKGPCIKKSNIEFMKQVPQNPRNSFRIRKKVSLKFSLARDPNQMEKEDLSGIIKNTNKKISRETSKSRTANLK